jgi:hypothetical protein
MAFEAIMAEVDQLNLAGDRIEGLADHHLPVSEHSCPSREMFVLQQRYWQYS